MRCIIEKSVDIVAEVDVDVDDVFSELFSRVSDDAPRRRMQVLDSCTRILMTVSDSVIRDLPDSAREEMRKRLQEELARYQSPQAITEEALAASGAAPGQWPHDIEHGRWCWLPCEDSESRTYVSVLPLAGGAWMCEITQSGLEEQEPRWAIGIGLPVSTMSQLHSLLQLVRGCLLVAEAE